MYPPGTDFKPLWAALSNISTSHGMRLSTVPTPEEAHIMGVWALNDLTEAATITEVLNALQLLADYGLGDCSKADFIRVALKKKEARLWSRDAAHMFRALLSNPDGKP